ncbi:type II toxin-antitoxin system PemK/MazF family toxin [Cryptosporangium sp. NPDC048952]|uniref:type II toxin-antitoxin system PemK/MazF family toxin n=1 Tax=Cryptosporangium sp. NPDC048952 TaxID=3363961 RepID=UPI003716A1D9
MRGDVHELKAPRDARGHDQRGNRFAVVVQNDLLPLSTLLVAPTSTSARPTSFRPEIEIEGKTTYVLAEQTAAVQAERLGRIVGHLSHTEMTAVDAALRTVLSV